MIALTYEAMLAPTLWEPGTSYPKKRQQYPIRSSRKCRAPGISKGGNETLVPHWHPISAEYGNVPSGKDVTSYEATSYPNKIEYCKEKSSIPFSFTQLELSTPLLYTTRLSLPTKRNP